MAHMRMGWSSRDLLTGEIDRHTTLEQAQDACVAAWADTYGHWPSRWTWAPMHPGLPLSPHNRPRALIVNESRTEFYIEPCRGET